MNLLDTINDENNGIIDTMRELAYQILDHYHPRPVKV